ncbi:TPA: hypothetical protein QDB31_005468 [Burkholderia vietnamiensis]|nr:hypothetical protein [Burkholderia vietnamiensis]
MADSDEFSKEGFFSMIEKAFKPQFFLLTLCFALFIDSALVYFCGVGFKDAGGGANSLSMSLGIKITLAFLAFSGLVSMILPFVHGLAVQMYLATLYPVWGKFELFVDKALGFDKQQVVPKRRENDCVRPWELRHEAHATQSEFLLGLYDDYRRQEQRDETNQRKTQFYAFCALFFTGLNYWVPGNMGDHTVTHWIEAYCLTSAPIWIALVTFASLMFVPFHIDNFDSKWVYCPPLHRRLEAKAQEEREKERKWREEIEQDVARMQRDRERARQMSAEEPTR